MGRKDRTFAAKLGKDKTKSGRKCSTCGELLNMVYMIDSQQSTNNTWKFKEKMVGVCKCNQKEIYG